MTRTRAAEILTEALLLAYCGGFLAWYVWAKLALLPVGAW
jgi:hypothetical protein